MKKQALTLAIAAALSAPSALAAQDQQGMHYTSAAEGFYASIRVRYDSGAKEDEKGGLENSTSRFGVRGSNDLGGGLEGFYQYEAYLGIDDSGDDNALDTRLAFVGLRGAFGQVQMGSFWPQSYNWVSAGTDLANKSSGNALFATHGDSLTQYRTSRSLEYTTPDLNGFQGALLAQSRNSGVADGNNLDLWNLSAKYTVQGFTVSGSYQNRPDVPSFGEVGALQTALRGATVQGVSDLTKATVTTDKDDSTGWAVGLGYGQDNWNVHGWYGKNNASDFDSVSYDLDGADTNGANTMGTITGKRDDSTFMSLAAGITLDKVYLYAIHERAESSAATGEVSSSGTGAARVITLTTRDETDTYSTLGVQYNLGSRSRVWLEYAMRDLDTDKYADGAANPNRADNSFNIGMRHDF